MTPTSNEQEDSDRNRWVTGAFFGLQVPGDLETLLSGGTDFLTEAFRASGAMSADNSVRRIVSSEGFEAGGSGTKALLTVAYEVPEPGLPERLFIKFSRNFDNELWDRARFMMVSEVKFALLSRSPDFPVPVARLVFADVELASGTGLLITECIAYGTNGIEPRYVKCMDYVVPDQVGHYKAILRGLARLSGTHRAGKLSPDFDTELAGPSVAASMFGTPVPEDTVMRRAIRLFEFIERHPQLFPEDVRSPELREQFMRDIPDVIAARERIAELLNSNPDFIAFAHWNGNIDNCWFERLPDGTLRAGFLDWANAGHLSVARSITGAISCAESVVWDEHLDELLSLFIDEYAAHGGPLLDLDELRLHVLLGTAAGFADSMGAPVALAREFADVGALESSRDPQLVVPEHENARIQLHLTTRMLSQWQTRKLGDLVRAL